MVIKSCILLKTPLDSNYSNVFDLQKEGKLGKYDEPITAEEISLLFEEKIESMYDKIEVFVTSNRASNSNENSVHIVFTAKQTYDGVDVTPVFAELRNYNYCILNVDNYAVPLFYFVKNLKEENSLNIRTFSCDLEWDVWTNQYGNLYAHYFDKDNAVVRNTMRLSYGSKIDDEYTRNSFEFNPVYDVRKKEDISTCNTGHIYVYDKAEAEKPQIVWFRCILSPTDREYCVSPDAEGVSHRTFMKGEYFEYSSGFYILYLPYAIIYKDSDDNNIKITRKFSVSTVASWVDDTPVVPIVHYVGFTSNESQENILKIMSGSIFADYIYSCSLTTFSPVQCHLTYDFTTSQYLIRVQGKYQAFGDSYVYGYISRMNAQGTAVDVASGFKAIACFSSLHNREVIQNENSTRIGKEKIEFVENYNSPLTNAQIENYCNEAFNFPYKYKTIRIGDGELDDYISGLDCKIDVTIDFSIYGKVLDVKYSYFDNDNVEHILYKKWSNKIVQAKGDTLPYSIDQLNQYLLYNSSSIASKELAISLGALSSFASPMKVGDKIPVVGAISKGIKTVTKFSEEMSALASTKIDNGRKGNIVKGGEDNSLNNKYFDDIFEIEYIPDYNDPLFLVMCKDIYENGSYVSIRKSVIKNERIMFDYIKTNECELDIDINENDRKKLEQIFDNGVRKWHIDCGYENKWLFKSFNKHIANNDIEEA